MMTPITAKAVTTSCQVVFVGAWRIMRVPPVRGHTASGVRLPRAPRPWCRLVIRAPQTCPHARRVSFSGFGRCVNRVLIMPTSGIPP